MKVAPAVKERMRELNISGAELARRTGYSYSYIQDLLRGRRRWNEEAIECVGDVLGLQLELVDATGITG